MHVGQVHRALYRGMPVAVKFVSASSCCLDISEQDGLNTIGKNFRNELSIMCRIRHPNIVR